MFFDLIKRPKSIKKECIPQYSEISKCYATKTTCLDEIKKLLECIQNNSKK